MGGLTRACVAAAGGETAMLGALLGVAGGIAGCFGGHRARTGLVRALGTPDVVVAVLEDLVAIGAALWIVSSF